MNIVVHIPDDLAKRLSASGDVERQALEALALETFRADRLTKSELGRMLGLEGLNELDGFLKAHGVFEPYTMTDLERDRQALDRLGL